MLNTFISGDHTRVIMLCQNPCFRLVKALLFIAYLAECVVYLNRFDKQEDWEISAPFLSSILFF